MIRQQPNQTEFTDFIHPFGGKLPTSNRWIKLSQLVPWDEVQTIYSKGFKMTKMGAQAPSGRIAFGALSRQIPQGGALLPYSQIPKLRKNS